MSPRPRTPLALAALLTSVGLLALAAPALATPGSSHVLTSTFGSATSTVTDPYPLLEPTDIVVDQRPGPAQGDSYVADTGNHRIVKFSPTGEFILMFGKEVDATNHGNICTAASHDTCQPGVSVSSPGGLEAPTYLAIDESPAGEGDLYVADNGDALLSKFDPSGHLVTSWGESGQKDGSDISGNLAPGFASFAGLAVDSANGRLYVNIEGQFGAVVVIFSRVGVFFSPNSNGYLNTGNRPGLALGTDDYLYYYRDTFNPGMERRPKLGSDINGEETPVTKPGVVDTGFGLDPLTGGIYQDTGTSIAHYSDACEPLQALCEPLDFFGEGNLSGAGGLAVYGPAAGSRTVYVADTEADEIAVFSDIRPTATATAPTEVTETALTLTGHVDLAATHPEGHPEIVECHFEYGFDKSYGTSLPCEPDPETTPFTAQATPVMARLTGLQPLANLPIGTRYHYRLVATSAEGGTGFSADHAAQTTAPPQIEGVSSSHLTATSAQLHVTIVPNGLPTTYRFEYGPTTEYGQTTPLAELTGTSEQLEESHTVTAAIQGLQPGVTYHYRVLVENQLDQGTPVISEDLTFEFFPPNCPNSEVRQQTGTIYLPDCRAYELVSPPNANGTLLYSGGPTSPSATSPSRFAYSGAFSAPPGVTENIGGVADLYVATRTSTGWESRYVGPSSTTTGCAGGPPNDPWSYVTHTEKLEDRVLTSPSMDRFLDFDLGTGYRCFLGGGPVSSASNELDVPSNAGYLWTAAGASLGRLPTGVQPQSEALAAFDCPTESLTYSLPHCAGDAAASGDLTHFVFSSNSHAFAPGGITAPPGSAYDDNLQTGTITLISRLEGGEPITQDPSYALTPPEFNQASTKTALGGPEEFLRFPAVSTDGSHILISTATANTELCDKTVVNRAVCPRFTDTPIHLYMSIADRPAVEISKSELTGEDVAIDYVGMLPDGSQVYFTSQERLLAADQDNSTDLYMWSQKGQEEGHPLTLISKAAPGSAAGAGNADSCEPVDVSDYDAVGHLTGESPWTTNCDVVPYSDWSYATAPGSRGGNGLSDSPIASRSGDVYFYSPELLDGDHGIPGQQNFYVFRAGQLHYVATLGRQKPCGHIVGENTNYCASGPIARFEVTPDGSRAAFVTSTRLTPYDNAGHLELYLYTAATGRLLCASCRPDGEPPTSDVQTSQDGRYITDDGRVFFSTTEPLVAQDTDEAVDVYEYVDGRPQLITPGTGSALNAPEEQAPGLVGVSADGTDVYVDTFDTFISEDHNGTFFKFYDARSNGGFPRPAPAQPCAAAEECHGPGTEAPVLPTAGSAAQLSGGNVAPKTPKRHRRHRLHPRAHRHAHRHANANGRRP
jgi:hypothetical protein